jgi:hypothetical protein
MISARLNVKHRRAGGEQRMTDNIFSGLKVVDLASFIAGPSAAVILSDFGADVIKVEPPSGELWRHANKLPPRPQANRSWKRLLLDDIRGFGNQPRAALPGQVKPDPLRLDAETVSCGKART